MITFRPAYAALVLTIALPATASAGHYSPYTYSQQRGYGYRTYTYFSHKHQTHHRHIAVYHPHHKKHVYYYNVQTKKYWGRYDLETGKYSVLANDEKKGTIGEIPESAFPAGGDMPPEEAGNEALLPPPEAKTASTQLQTELERMFPNPKLKIDALSTKNCSVKYKP